MRNWQFNVKGILRIKFNRSIGGNKKISVSLITKMILTVNKQLR